MLFKLCNNRKMVCQSVILNQKDIAPLFCRLPLLLLDVFLGGERVLLHRLHLLHRVAALVVLDAWGANQTSTQLLLVTHKEALTSWCQYIDLRTNVFRVVSL